MIMLRLYLFIYGQTRRHEKRHNFLACSYSNFLNSQKTTGLPSTNTLLKTKNCIFDRSILVLWVFEILFVDDKVHLELKYGNNSKIR